MNERSTPGESKKISPQSRANWLTFIYKPNKFAFISCALTSSYLSSHIAAAATNLLFIKKKKKNLDVGNEDCQIASSTSDLIHERIT